MTYRIDDIRVPHEDPFQNDKLERKPVVDFLSDLIGRLDGPFIMALDSTFGMGKSTLVRILIECLKKEGHRCIYFDAWKVDYATDPLLALVALIDCIDFGCSDQNQKDEYQKRIQKIKTITNDLAISSSVNTVKMLTAGIIDLNTILGQAKSSAPSSDGNRDLVAEFNQESKLFEKFRDELTKAVKLLENDDAEANSRNKTGSNLVIFVDELDRCRPNFAVQLLERIKHLFDIPNIVFVLSLDKNQIETSIKAVYGAEIDATEYLRRFFNLEYGIPDSDTKNYISSLVTRFDLDSKFKEPNHPLTHYARKDFVEYFNIFANATGLSLRTIERCMTRFRIVMDQTPSNQFLDTILLALLIVLHSYKPEIYDQIINGQLSPEDTIKFLTSLPDVNISQEHIYKLHAHLLLADSDSARAKIQIEEFKSKPSEDEMASLILMFYNKIYVTHRPHISLVQIAKKIDLVSWIS